MPGSNKLPAIVHLTPFYPPNIGGVETYLSDLISLLQKKGFDNRVLTYSPLTSRFHAPAYESQPHLSVIRFPHLGFNLFHRLEKHPLLNFIYLTPYLFFGSFIYFLFNNQRLNIIHAHGLNSAFIGLILKLIFKKPLLVNLYSNYDHVPFNSFFYRLIKFTLNRADFVLTQSQLSLNQLTNLGISPSRLGLYRHWINLDQFSPPPTKSAAKLFLGLKPAPTFLFIGRLIPQKGALLLAQIAPHFPQAQFVFVGSGPQYQSLLKLSYSHPNIIIFPDVDYSRLHHYYQAADYFLFPSQYSEGWGRVAMEAVACGLPVIGSNLGAITENLNSQVSLLFKPTPLNFKSTLKNILLHPQKFRSLSASCRPFALAHFSSKNSQTVTRQYLKLFQSVT